MIGLVRQLLPWVLLLVGCAGSEPRFGELGVVELAYADGNEQCRSDCDPSSPVAVGATALLQIQNPEAVPRVSLRALDPEALEVLETFSRELWRVRPLRAGEHTVVFEDVRDEEIDRFVIDAREVAAVAVEREVEPLGTEPVTVQLAAYDDGGEALRGYSFVDASSSENVSVRRLEVPELLEGFDSTRMSFARPPNYEAFELGGDGSGGVGTITFSAPSGATLELTVSVLEVPPTQVSSVILSSSPASYAVDVTAAFTVAVEGASPPCCEWSIEPAGEGAVLSPAWTCSEARALSTTMDPVSATIVCEADGARGELEVTITGP